MKKIALLLLSFLNLHPSSPSASSDNPAKASDPAKVSEKDVKGLDIEESAKKVALSDKHQELTTRKLSAAALRNPEVSAILKTAHAINPEAASIPVSFLTAEELDEVIPALEHINAELPEPKKFSTISAVEKRDLLAALVRTLHYFKGPLSPRLAFAAHYLDSPALEAAALWIYADYLHSKRNNPGILAQITKNQAKILPEMWEDISRYYFLQFDEDIDFDLWPRQGNAPQKRVFIDADVLIAYKKFPIRVPWKEIAKNPNVVFGANHTLLSWMITFMVIENNSEPTTIKYVRAAFKLKDLDAKKQMERKAFDTNTWQWFRQHKVSGDSSTTLPQAFPDLFAELLKYDARLSTLAK